MSTTLADPPVAGARPPRGPPPRARRRVPLWLAIVATSLPMFMATLDNLVMTSALPVIRADLGSSVDQLSWFVNAYTLAFATFMLPAATLGDRLGRRRVMLAGVTLFTARLDRLGAEHHLRGADRGPRRPGPRRRGDHAAVADPARRRGADRRCAPIAIGIWGGVVRPRRRARPGRSAARSSRASAGRRSSGSTCRSRWSPSRCCWSRSASRAAPGSGSTCVGTVLLGGAVFLGIWGIVHGNDDGWTSPVVLGSLVVAGAAGAGVRRPRRAAAPTPCCRCGCSRSAGLLRRQRDRPDLHAGHVRRGVPARAVPADRAGLQPARGRHPHPAVDRGADGGRADRRRCSRRAPGSGRCSLTGPGAAGRRRWSGSRR